MQRIGCGLQAQPNGFLLILGNDWIAVIFNITHTDDGKVRSVQSLDLYCSQQFVTAIYRAHLADKLQALGYEIQVDPRTGAPEIKGFGEEYLQDSSPRRKEVLKEEAQMKESIEREGKTFSDIKRRVSL